MKNLYNEAYQMGYIRKITKEELMFTSIKTDIYNVVEEIWYRAKNNIDFYDVGESFIGYTKEELTKFVTSVVTTLYDDKGVSYEL